MVLALGMQEAVLCEWCLVAQVFRTGHSHARKTNRWKGDATTSTHYGCYCKKVSERQVPTNTNNESYRVADFHKALKHARQPAGVTFHVQTAICKNGPVGP